MPDPFVTLPSPLPLFILKGLEDLSSLYHVLQASPDANAIFTDYYCETIESILSNLTPQLQRLLRIVMSIKPQSSDIRARCISTHDFNNFQEAYILHDDAGSTLVHKTPHRSLSFEAFSKPRARCKAFVRPSSRLC